MLNIIALIEDYIIKILKIESINEILLNSSIIMLYFVILLYCNIT